MRGPAPVMVAAARDVRFLLLLTIASVFESAGLGRKASLLEAALGTSSSSGNETEPSSRSAFAQIRRHRASEAVLGARPPLFGGPAVVGSQLNLQGFCKRPDDEPACTSTPCCCWSLYAHRLSEVTSSDTEVKSKQKCLNPPDGFIYTPEPGLSFDDGYKTMLKDQGYTVYSDRRLCCLREKHGIEEESQMDLADSVKTSPTTTTAVPTTTTAEGPPPPDEVPAAFTTKAPETTTLPAPGDEFETAQMEAAAKAHLKAAEDITEAVSALNSSATAITVVRERLETDPNLVKSRQRAARIKAAIGAWSARRWQNLEKLKTGDASAFAPAAPAPAAAMASS